MIFNRRNIKQGVGFNGKPGPYRTSTSLGFPYAELAAFHAVAGTSYIQIHIVNDFYSTAGWGRVY